MQQPSSFSCGILFRKFQLIVGGKSSERPHRSPRKSINTLYNRWVFGLACILAVALIVSLPYEGLAMEYGATGPFRVEVKTFENSMWPQRDGGVPVTVLLPAQRDSAVPVVFFSHGLEATSWFSYRSLLRHVTSWGVAVVFSPYPPSSNWSNQYNILWNGFKRAAELYAADFDLSRVGFAGHSYGGGATPNMALRARKAGWGTQGMFMFIMAPAPASGVSNAALKSLFPGQLDHAGV